MVYAYILVAFQQVASGGATWHTIGEFTSFDTCQKASAQLVSSTLDYTKQAGLTYPYVKKFECLKK